MWCNNKVKSRSPKNFQKNPKIGKFLLICICMKEKLLKYEMDN